MNVSQQKHSYASAEIHSRKSSDFREWISANGFRLLQMHKTQVDFILHSTRRHAIEQYLP